MRPGWKRPLWMLWVSGPGSCRKSPSAWRRSSPWGVFDALGRRWRKPAENAEGNGGRPGKGSAARWNDAMTRVSPPRIFRPPLLCAAQRSDILLLQGRSQFVAPQHAPSSRRAMGNLRCGHPKLAVRTGAKRTQTIDPDHLSPPTAMASYMRMRKTDGPFSEIRTERPATQPLEKLRRSKVKAVGTGLDYAATAKKSAHRNIDLRHFR